MYAYSRGIDAGQNTDQTEAPDSTITAPSEVRRIDVLPMPICGPTVEASISGRSPEARPSLSEPLAKPSGRRQRRRDPGLQQLKARIGKLREEGLTHREICERLGDGLRPPYVKWRDLSWPIAYKRHTPAVAKWLSEAAS